LEHLVCGVDGVDGVGQALERQVVVAHVRPAPGSLAFDQAPELKQQPRQVVPVHPHGVGLSVIAIRVVTGLLRHRGDPFH
jgi:hypothetical protein